MINVSVDFQRCYIWRTTHQHGYRIIERQRGNGNIVRYYYDFFFYVVCFILTGVIDGLFFFIACDTCFPHKLGCFYKPIFFLTGNSSWRLWGCRCSDRIWRWGEWEAAGRGGAAVCLVYEVVHCRHIWHRHCVCMVMCLMVTEIKCWQVSWCSLLPFSFSTGPVFPLWLIMCFTAMCAITAATHTSSENKQVGFPWLINYLKLT